MCVSLREHHGVTFAENGAAAYVTCYLSTSYLVAHKAFTELFHLSGPLLLSVLRSRISSLLRPFPSPSFVSTWFLIFPFSVSPLGPMSAQYCSRCSCPASWYVRSFSIYGILSPHLPVSYVLFPIALPYSHDLTNIFWKFFSGLLHIPQVYDPHRKLILTAILLKVSQTNLKIMYIHLENRKIYILIKNTQRALFVWRGSYTLSYKLILFIFFVLHSTLPINDR